MRPRAGFTVLEILVAAMLTAMLISAMYFLFGQAEQISSQGNRLIEMYSNAAATFEGMDADLAAMLPFNRGSVALDPAAAPVLTLFSSGTYLSDTTEKPLLKVRCVTRFVGNSNAVYNRAATVSYYLNKGAERLVPVLMRRVTVAPADLTLLGETGIKDAESEMCRFVRDARVDFLFEDPAAVPPAMPRQWREATTTETVEWPDRQPTVPPIVLNPKAVKISLVLSDGIEPPRVYRVVRRTFFLGQATVYSK